MQCVQMINSQLWNVCICEAYTCQKPNVYHHDSVLGSRAEHTATPPCMFDCMHTMCVCSCVSMFVRYVCVVASGLLCAMLPFRRFVVFLIVVFTSGGASVRCV